MVYTDSGMIYIKNCVIAEVGKAQYGGMVYAATESYVQVDDTDVEQIHDVRKGAGFYLQDYSTLKINGGTYSDIYNFVGGGLVELSFSAVEMKDVTITGIYQDNEAYSTSTGGLVEVATFNQAVYDDLDTTDTLYITLEDVTVSDVSGIYQGGVIYMQGYTLTITDSIFDGIDDSNDGDSALLYIADFEKTSYTISDSEFKDFALTSSPAIIDQSTCPDDLETHLFTGNTFENIISATVNALASFSTSGCHIEFTSNIFNNIASTATSNAVNTDAAI